LRVRTSALIVMAAAALVVAAPAAARTTLVVAKVPLNHTVSDLLRGTFKEKVTCARACSVKTSVGIRPAVARALGFQGVKAGRLLQIGTNRARLKAGRAAQLGFVLSPEAKRLLPRARSNLQLIGSVQVLTASAPSRRATAGWIVTLNLTK